MCADLPWRKRSSLLKKEDYGKYDYIIGMDDSNIRDMKRILGGDPEKKIYKLLSFADDPGDVADPYYTENFDVCYDDIMRGLGGFLEHCKKIIYKKAASSRQLIRIYCSICFPRKPAAVCTSFSWVRPEVSLSS